MNHHSFHVTSDVRGGVRVGAVHLQECTRARVSPRERRNDAELVGFYLSRIGLHDQDLINRARAQWDIPYLLPLLSLVDLRLYTFRMFVKTLKREYARHVIIIATVFNIPSEFADFSPAI